jgi:hypothetical protein
MVIIKKGQTKEGKAIRGSLVVKALGYKPEGLCGTIPLIDRISTVCFVPLSLQTRIAF